jgi:hypothetical protein
MYFAGKWRHTTAIMRAMTIPQAPFSVPAVQAVRPILSCVVPLWKAAGSCWIGLALAHAAANGLGEPRNEEESYIASQPESFFVFAMQLATAADNAQRQL